MSVRFWRQVRWIIPGCIVLLTLGCAGRKSPAPVENVYKRVIDKHGNSKPRRTIWSKTHKVKKGDTLYSIAWRAGMDFRKLAKLNKIGAPYAIYVDQTLLLRPKTRKADKTPSKAKTKSNKIKAPIAVTAVAPKMIPVVAVKPPSTKLKHNVAKTLADKKKGEYRRTKQKQKPPKKVHSVKKSAQTNKPKKKQYSNKIKQWVWPTRGKVIAGFSNRENGNKGIDIGGKNGTSIVSAADGKVVYYGNALRGYGNLVIIKHNDDYLSAYAHNRRILVKEKDFVKAGQKIAEMGSTDSQNVKLHFEVRYRGKSVNPLKYLPKR